MKAGHGTFDAESARHLMDRPVAMKSNLHSVLFETSDDALGRQRLEGRQARREQPYHAFQFTELLTHSADPSAPSLPAPPATAPASASASR